MQLHGRVAPPEPHSWRTVFVGVLLLTGLCLPDAARGRLPDAARDQWTRVETPHFICYTNGDQSRLAKLLLELERLREALRLTTSGLDKPAVTPTYFLAFKDRESYFPYNMRRESGEATVIGQFQGAPDVHYLVFAIPSGGESKHIIYHEFMHSVLQNNVPGVPLWLNEGLAEYYSTFESTARTAEIGRIIDYHFAVLNQRPLIPIRNLLVVKTQSHRYTDPGQSAIFYAQSWALTHMLTNEPGGAERVRGYLSAIAEGQNALRAFEATFGSNYPALESRLRSYAQQDDFSYTKYSFNQSFEKLTSTSYAINSKEILALLGDVQLRHQPSRIEEAREHFLAALAIDALYAPALYGLGYAAELEGDSGEALRQYRLAIEASPNDPRALFLAGQSIAGGYFQTPGRVAIDQRTPPDLLEARALLERSLAQAPGQPEALASLGKTYLFEWREAAQPGVWALQEALGLIPHRSDVWANLVALTARTGNRDAAVSMLHGRLEPLGEPVSTKAGWMGIAHADLREAGELTESGERDAAVELLERSVATLEDNDAKAGAVEMLSSLRTSSQHNEYVDLYNEALEYLRKRDYIAARGRFERVAKLAPSAELRAEAEARLDDIRFLEGTERVLRHLEHKRYDEADKLLSELEAMTLRSSQHDYLRGLRVTLEELRP